MTSPQKERWKKKLDKASVNFNGECDYIKVDKKIWEFPKNGAFTWTTDYKFNSIELPKKKRKPN